MSPNPNPNQLLRPLTRTTTHPSPPLPTPPRPSPPLRSPHLAPALPCPPLARAVARAYWLGARWLWVGAHPVAARGRLFSRTPVRARARVEAPRARGAPAAPPWTPLLPCTFRSYPPHSPLSQDSHGHKVLERERLEAIRQRLQQKYWGSQVRPSPNPHPSPSPNPHPYPNPCPNPNLLESPQP